MKKIFDIKTIAYNGIIAAIYVVLTLITYDFSYLGIQFRIAEILMLLVFFRKDSIIGLTLGCLIANLFSFSPWDILFGTLATVFSCLIMMFLKHLIIAVFIPVIFNGFIVAFELWWILEEPFWFSVLTVALGELAVLLLGYLLFMLLKRKKNYLESIGAKQNLGFKF